MKEAPVVFISYAWYPELHRQWVRDLAARLVSDGIRVVLDQWDTIPGDRLPLFMERAVNDSDFVLIVCTPEYKKRSDSRLGGVGYEGDIMTSAVLIEGVVDKFIPILRDGEPRTAIPVWLMSKYAPDFRGETISEDVYQKLLSAFYRSRNTVAFSTNRRTPPMERATGKVLPLDQPKIPLSEIIVVQPDNGAIPALMRLMMESATWWRYQGGTGTWFRAATLPTLARRARESNTAIDIYVQTLDPRNEDLCYAYAAYRRSVHSAQHDKLWTEDRVRCEVLATVATLSILKYTDALLGLGLTFIPYHSSFRYDMSNETIVVTTEDPRAPCLRVDSGTYYYEAYRSELVRSFNQAKAVPLDSRYVRTKRLTLADVTPSIVDGVLADLGYSEYYEDDDLESIAFMMRDPINRYDRY